MTQEEIIEMAIQGHAGVNTHTFCVICTKCQDAIRWAMKQERETYMQLFLDPENQPTQFGTATQEYRTQEIQEIQSLLTEIANIVRTKHIYGPEMKKLLAKEEAIRARGKA
jgi:hypothetical protein